MGYQEANDAIVRVGVRPKGKERTKLDRYNDRPDPNQDNKYLHATKGYRVASPKRVQAALITAERMNGISYNNSHIKNLLNSQ